MATYMLLHSTVMCFVLISAVLCGSIKGVISDSGSTTKLYNEEDCLKAGGMCLLENECPEGSLADKGLCPKQSGSGVECCYGISTNERTCRGLGGECEPKGKCARFLVRERAEDCSPGTKCCVKIY